MQDLLPMEFDDVAKEDFHQSAREFYGGGEEDELDSPVCDALKGLCKFCLGTNFLHEYAVKEDGQLEIKGILFDRELKIIKKCGCKSDIFI